MLFISVVVQRWQFLLIASGILAEKNKLKVVLNYEMIIFIEEIIISKKLLKMVINN